MSAFKWKLGKETGGKKIIAQMSHFVTGTALGEVQVSLFVARALFGEVQGPLFVAGAVFGEFGQ